MKCPHCQTLNTQSDSRCVSCGAPLRQLHMGAWKWALFYSAICLLGVAAGMLYMHGQNAGRPGRVLTTDEMDNRVGRLIGSVCGVGMGIATFAWLRSRR
jgi:hypothetical protein